MRTVRRFKAVNHGRSLSKSGISGSEVALNGYVALLNKILYNNKKNSKKSRSNNTGLSAFIAVIDSQLNSKRLQELRQTKLFRIVQFSGLILLFIGFMIGSWYFYENYRSNQAADELIEVTQNGLLQNEGIEGDPNSGNNDSVIVPATNKPSIEDVMAHKSPANQPKRIEINKIDVFARVSEVGNNSKGQVGVPVNVYDASWYNFSSEVGRKPGSSVIVGHVGFRSIEGVFSKLDELKTGDKITITMGDDRVLNYIVSESKSIKLDDFSMSDYLSYNNQNDSLLHLITCSGSILRGSTSYDSRLVVTAELYK